MHIFSTWFSTARQLQKLEANQEELIERMEKLEHVLKGAQLDWDDLYEKMRRLHGRVQKRAALIERADAQNEVGVDGPEASIDPVSERILARRRRLNHVVLSR